MEHRYCHTVEEQCDGWHYENRDDLDNNAILYCVLVQNHDGRHEDAEGVAFDQSEVRPLSHL